MFTYMNFKGKLNVSGGTRGTCTLTLSDMSRLLKLFKLSYRSLH